jgi:uncharacterized protein YrrD
MLRSAKDLFGTALHAADGLIGHVHDIYFDDHKWTVRYYVVDTGHFLPGRKVLIPPHAVDHAAPGEVAFPVRLTCDQIRHSPEIDTDRPVERRAEASLYDYYGWTPYWFPMEAAPQIHFYEDAAHREKTVTEGKAGGDPHLRSAREVIGYHVGATDGEIGHVHDFLIDDETGVIRYAVVDTRNWLPGKHVLIEPKWIRTVHWAESKVWLVLSRDAVWHSPEYTTIAALDPESAARAVKENPYPLEWL